MASPVPVGAFFDLFPVSVLTTSSEPRFVENDWVGRELTIGDAMHLKVAMPDPRCVMTTLAQDDLPRDTDVLRTLAQHNQVQVGGGGHYPCAGAYAVIGDAGTIRIGDSVAIS